MRQRTFEIIRVPELEGTAFLFNNVRVSYVATCPETGISFYCSLTQNYGVRVYPDGRKALVTATRVKYGHTEYSHGKADYLKFKQAFGRRKHILASHAVWMAAGRNIPTGFSIDHINGCTTDNHIRNLRCIDIATNRRDGGFLTKLRNQGIDPTAVKRNYLLRYFCRMAFIKANISRRRYCHLSRIDLMTILFYDLIVVMDHFEKTYNIELKIPFLV